MDFVQNPGGADFPFKLSPPQDAFRHPSWQRAEQRIHEALRRGASIALLGQPGTGKTLLLRVLAQQMREQGTRIHELQRDGTLEAPDVDIVLIDEAGLFAPEQLERIARLPQPFVIAALPSLSDRLARCLPGVGRVELEPLAPESVARFVVGRMISCGRARDMFTPEALVALAQRSKGLLRLVNILAGGALFFAEQRGAAAVTGSDVDETAAMRVCTPDPAEPETTPRGPALADAPVRPRARPRPKRRAGRLFVRAGLGGWMCASLATIALAVAAASAIGTELPVPVQETIGRSLPSLAETAVPTPASQPALAAADPAAVPVLAAPTPTAALRARTPAPAPVPPPETVQAGAELATVPAVPSPAASIEREPETTPLAFQGPIMNDTMGQGGQLSLQLRNARAGQPIDAFFHASHGLIGTGTLTGELGPQGLVNLSGQLMMGRNVFYCALRGTMRGDRLVGEATFIRQTSGARAHSSFTLTKL